MAILSEFTVLSLSSYFVVYFFELELILFHYRVVYYSTRIFLILFPDLVTYVVLYSGLFFFLKLLSVYKCSPFQVLHRLIIA